jgi:hypothetical protein
MNKTIFTLIAAATTLSGIAIQPAAAGDSVASNGEWAVFLKPNQTEAQSVVSFSLTTFQTFQVDAAAKWKTPICLRDVFLLLTVESVYEIRKYDLTLLGSGRLDIQGALGFVAKTDDGRIVAVKGGFDDNKAMLCQLLVLTVESGKLAITKTVPLKTIGYPVPFGSKVYVLSKDGVETINLDN